MTEKIDAVGPNTIFADDDLKYDYYVIRAPLHENDDLPFSLNNITYYNFVHQLEGFGVDMMELKEPAITHIFCVVGNLGRGALKER